MVCPPSPYELPLMFKLPVWKINAACVPGNIRGKRLREAFSEMFPSRAGILSSWCCACSVAGISPSEASWHFQKWLSPCQTKTHLCSKRKRKKERKKKNNQRRIQQNFTNAGKLLSLSRRCWTFLTAGKLQSLLRRCCTFLTAGKFIVLIETLLHFSDQGEIIVLIETLLHFSDLGEIIVLIETLLHFSDQGEIIVLIETLLHFSKWLVS